MKTIIDCRQFIVVLSLLIIILTSTYSQEKYQELPYSVVNNMQLVIPRLDMPDVDKNKLLKEDSLRGNYSPMRIGHPLEVNINLENSGEWIELEDGSQIWVLEIECKEATFIGVTFDQYWLPVGCSLHLFNHDKARYVGPYTDTKNRSSNKNIRGFSSLPVYADKITLELFKPEYVVENPILSINTVVHGYRKVTYFGDAGECNVNVACPVAESWKEHKQSVVWYSIGNVCGCSGSLINTDDDDETNDYLLTAQHCIKWPDSPCYYSYDADPTIGDGKNIDDATFYFYWESPTCANPSTSPPYFSRDGATVIANNGDSDFALLTFDESPLDPSHSVDLYYNGWDRSGNTPSDSTVCISHPQGDIKKIAIDRNSATTASTGFWSRYWKTNDYEVGVTERGSSGAPLYNNASLVVGQLYTGTSECIGDDDNGGFDYYGKFSVSWDNDATSIRQLRYWIDSDNSAGTTHTGLRVLRNIMFNNDDRSYTSEKFKIRNISIVNGSNIVFKCDEFLIIEKDFFISTGCTLEIN